MATGGETKFACCSPCLDDGRNTVARHYCVDCEIYFCAKCVKCHNNIPLLRKHQVNEVYSSNVSDVEDDTSDATTGRGSDSVDTFRCTLHEGKLIDTFCKNHNKVFCGSCTRIKHRSCATISLSVAAKDFKSSPEMKKFKDALTENLVQCKQERDKRSNNLDSVDKQKQDLIKDVDKHEEKLIAKIKELANISRQEIRSKYEEHKNAIDTEMEDLGIIIITAERYSDKLEETNDELPFVIVKTSEEVPKDGEMFLQAITKDDKVRVIPYYVDETLETRVLEVKSLIKVGNANDIEKTENVDLGICKLVETSSVDINSNESPVKEEYTCMGMRHDELYQHIGPVLIEDSPEEPVKYLYSELLKPCESVLIVNSLEYENFNKKPYEPLRVVNPYERNVKEKYTGIEPGKHYQQLRPVLIEDSSDEPAHYLKTTLRKPLRVDYSDKKKHVTREKQSKNFGEKRIGKSIFEWPKYQEKD